MKLYLLVVVSQLLQKWSCWFKKSPQLFAGDVKATETRNVRRLLIYIAVLRQGKVTFVPQSWWRALVWSASSWMICGSS